MQDNTLEVQETDRSCKVIHTKIVQILVHYLCLGMVERLGCMLDVSQIKLARLLRQAKVDKWLGENSSLYQSFLTEDPE